MKDESQSSVRQAKGGEPILVRMQDGSFRTIAAQPGQMLVGGDGGMSMLLDSTIVAAQLSGESASAPIAQTARIGEVNIDGIERIIADLRAQKDVMKVNGRVVRDNMDAAAVLLFDSLLGHDTMSGVPTVSKKQSTNMPTTATVTPQTRASNKPAPRPPSF